MMRLPLQLTALTLLMRPMGPWPIRVSMLVLATLALLHSPVLLSRWTWLLLAALVAARVALDWPLADNHVYLLAYWCLAIALALGSPAASATLARSAVLLLAAAFAMALTWKTVLSDDYLDGRFFRVTLLTDDRFVPAVERIGGLSRAVLGHNRDTLTPLPDGAELLDPPPLVEPVAFRTLVHVSTFGALVIEAAVVAGCIAVLAGASPMVLHIPLLLFCAVTYGVAPVAGFGWLLLSMGSALQSGRRTLAGVYVGLWCLILLYDGIRL
jgi:hypothetical protein